MVFIKQLYSINLGLSQSFGKLKAVSTDSYIRFLSTSVIIIYEYEIQYIKINLYPNLEHERFIF